MVKLLLKIILVVSPKFCDKQCLAVALLGSCPRKYDCSRSGVRPFPAFPSGPGYHLSRDTMASAGQWSSPMVGKFLLATQTMPSVSSHLDPSPRASFDLSCCVDERQGLLQSVQHHVRLSYLEFWSQNPPWIVSESLLVISVGSSLFCEPPELCPQSLIPGTSKNH